MTEAWYPAVLGEILRAAASGAAPPGIKAPWRDDDRLSAFLKSRGLYSLSGCASPAWTKACDAIWDVQRQEFGRVLGALSEAGASPLVFKGGELVRRFFGERAVDVGADLDVLVPRDATDEAKAVLYALGYRQGVFDPTAMTLRPRDTAEIGRIEAQHYELAPFMKMIRLAQDDALAALAIQRGRGPLHLIAGTPRLVIEIDVHHNVASDVELGMPMERATESVWDGANTFCDADHLWINLSRLYNEYALHGAVSLRPLAYTAPLLTRGAVAWDDLIDAARRMELGPTLWHLLATLDHLLPGTVPGDVLDAVYQPGAETWRDWGWQIARPFGFRERFPAYAFS